MPTSLPVTLVLAWALFFAFLLAQAHHERELKASPYLESPTFVKAVEISSLLGLLSGLGILGYYFYRASWYWPIALALGGSVIGALLMGALSGIMGNATLSKRAFVGWPLCGLWAIQVIHSIP